MAKKNHNAKDASEWRKDHWAAIALADLICWAATEDEENERLAALRVLKKKWGHTLKTGYDPNAVRPVNNKQEGVSKAARRQAEEYVPTPGIVGASGPYPRSRRVPGPSHGR